MENFDLLLEACRKARENAHAPYSGFRLGSVAVTTAGSSFAGCNVENSAYGSTVCAERNAIAAAVAGGMGRGELAGVMLLAGDVPPVLPCGACLQVIAEFASPDFEFVSVNSEGTQKSYRLADLLPCPFDLPEEAS